MGRMIVERWLQARGRPLLAIILLAGLFAGCALPPREGRRAAAVPRRGVLVGRRPSGLAYGSAPDLQGNQVTLRLDLYQPTGDTAARRPAIVWVHGGGFTTGSRTDSYIVDLATSYAKLGYVSASISYRLLAPNGCGGAATSECVTAAIAAKHDAQAAVRWLRANAANLRVDSSRIAIGGASAGRHRAARRNPVRGHRHQRKSRLPVERPLGGLALRRPAEQRHDRLGRRAHRVLPRHRRPHGSLRLGNVQLPGAARRARLHDASLFEGAGHCVPAESRSFILDQSKYFLYYLMDLGALPRRAAPRQPASASRARLSTRACSQATAPSCSGFIRTLRRIRAPSASGSSSGWRATSASRATCSRLR